MNLALQKNSSYSFQRRRNIKSYRWSISTDFTGTIEKVNEEKRKLQVMVKIFGRKTPLELSYMQVEKYKCYINI